MQFSDPEQERIFLDALATYADSCVQPALTPSCPFYRLTDGGPTCGEECRDILEAHGVANRPIRSVSVDGIRMTGRAIPRAVVTGDDEFDAAQQFLRDRGLPVQEQSTAALMLSLGTDLNRNVLGSRRSSERALELWGELTRRGIDMDRVFAGGIAPALAITVSVRVIIELLDRDGLVDANNILGSSDDGSVATWADVVAQAALDSPRDPHLWVDARLGLLVAVLGSEIAFLSEGATLDSILGRQDIQYVLSMSFAWRVTEWYVGLAGHDLEAALRCDVPTSNLFAALPAREPHQVGGLWIWERFTKTELEVWASSSLIQEWQWSRGGTTDLCDNRVMGERTELSDHVADVAMLSLSRESDAPPSQEMFEPGKFVQAAANYLAVGEWDKAAKIFEGIVELRPGDGEAWNNLGFCQLGNSAAVALPMLRRAAALQRPVPTISIANQVLALHLLARDDEALELADAYLADPQEGPRAATVWVHPSEEGELELGQVDEPLDYLKELRAHVIDGNCTTRGDDVAELAAH